MMRLEDHNELIQCQGKTLFKMAANGLAVLVTRSGNKMRRRHIKFADDHAALSWCLDRRVTLILLPRENASCN
jgi:hypothetical protein